MTVRLDRFLARALGLSRRDVTRIARAGRVTLDQVPATDPALHLDPERARVALDGVPVVYLAQVTLLLHKPPGVVCATRDPSERTVLDLVPAAWLRPGLAPAGRLDKDATGLVLLTTDGELNHAVTHPRHHLPRVYLVDLEDQLAPDAAQRFAAGLRLRDGTVCAPAELHAEGAGRVRVVVREGRYHQVKRMIAATGGRVRHLHRVALGPLELDPALAPGELRPLRPEELRALGGIP
jgi:16S rRNA pseudouridine516 synthase